MSDAVEAALSAWFEGERWQDIGRDQNMPTKWRKDMAAALAAADKARAVTDEEVRGALWDGWTPIQISRILGDLHAAGMKVVRA